NRLRRQQPEHGDADGRGRLWRHADSADRRRRRARDERVKFLRLENPQPGRSIGLVFRRTSPRKADFAALGEVVKQSLDMSPAKTVNKKRADGYRKQPNKKGG